ncbi:hypothetical protein BDR22DRAFT_916980 [Usnea florida]
MIGYGSSVDPCLRDLCTIKKLPDAILSFMNEQLDLHLTWDNRRMFLKPIPGYLLEVYIRI